MSVVANSKRLSHLAASLLSTKMDSFALIGVSVWKALLSLLNSCAGYICLGDNNGKAVVLFGLTDAFKVAFMKQCDFLRHRRDTSSMKGGSSLLSGYWRVKYVGLGWFLKL